MGDDELLPVVTTDTKNPVAPAPAMPVIEVVSVNNKIADAVKRGVDEFTNVHLRNSDFSQDTPAWNHFQAGLPVLIESITKEVKGL